MHALKRSAVRSKRAAISTLSSSDPMRGRLLGDLPAAAMLPVAMSSSLKSSIGSSAGKHTCSAKPWRTVGVHGFGCWASVQLSLMSDSNSCSTSVELCTTVETGEDETVVVISHPDHFHNTALRHNSATNNNQFYYCAKAKAEFRRLLGTNWLGMCMYVCVCMYVYVCMCMYVYE